LHQDYPNYEVIIVTASAHDLSIPVVQSLLARTPKRQVKFVTAGVSEGRGEKVNNLIQAISQVHSQSEVFVFTDSDSRAHSRWLRELIAPLRDQEVGVATGYRWFFPKRGNFASVLRSAWNGSIATLLGNHDHNFAWGGSMAVRRATFERVRVLDYWNCSISDDYSLTRAIRDAKLKIRYEPRCLIAAHGDCNWSELLEWSTRQILITKIYCRRLWQLAFVSQFPFLIGWWWGIGQLGVAVWTVSGRTSLIDPTLPIRFSHLGVAMGVIYLFGVFRGLLRMKTINLIFPGQRAAINRLWWGYMLLAPLVSTLTAYNLIVSMFTSRLNWRGVCYELRSAGEVRVIDQRQ
jgi:ceramide glucosyltransferase